MQDSAAPLAAGATIQPIANSHIRKEEVVARVLEQQSDHPGLVHMISAMEARDRYRRWHDKASGKTFVRPDSGKCLHDAFSLWMRRRGGLSARADMVAVLSTISLRIPSGPRPAYPWPLVPREGRP